MAHYFESRWKIKGTILSPVHIGCDRVLDPFSIAYENGRIIEFDLAAAVRDADENVRRRLNERLKAPMTTEAQADAVRELILNDTPWRNHVRRSFAVSQAAKDSFGQRGERFIEKTRQAEIQLTAHDPLTGRRIIPGSSLKGALRTGVIEARARADLKVQMTGRQRDDDREWDRFQKQVLSYTKMEEDPFGEWKFSDCPCLPTCACTIDKPVLHRRGRMKQPMAFTSLIEVLDSQNDGPHFEGELAFVHRPKGIARGITFEEIIRAAKRHTRRTFNEAYRLVESPQSFPEGAADSISAIEAWIESTEKESTSCVVRVGRFSGFLEMTVAHQRYLKAFVQKGQTKREALSGQEANPTLRPLTDDGIPFGYVLLEFEPLSV